MIFFYECLAIGLIFHIIVSCYLTKEISYMPTFSKGEKIINSCILWGVPLFGSLYIWQILHLGPMKDSDGSRNFLGEDTHNNHD